MPEWNASLRIHLDVAKAARSLPKQQSCTKSRLVELDVRFPTDC